ncbi:MAG: TnsD family transposase [Lachnospiraceae bacterium]|nr:TnsD family transposase [Lachnospiraceae bacterium]
MTGFMPVIYPDELVYSWFCRYYVYSGYPNNKMALEDILYNRHNNPSKEFIGHLNPTMEQVIKNMYPTDKLVLEHTMFPQYARFIGCPNKKDALYRLGNDFCDAHQLFSILPRNEGDKYLKYCPLCATDDRKQYGEAYWHRKHQIRNMNVCTKHKCRLVKSTVPAKSEQSFTLDPAEIFVQDAMVKLDVNSLEMEFASYMEQIFEAPMDFENDIAIDIILYYGLEGTKYMSSNGRTRNTKMLADDIQNYYKGIGLNDVASIYQIQRTLLGNRSDFSIVCQIAFYLGISVGSLLYPSLSEKQILNVQETRCSKEETPEDWNQYDEEMVSVLEKVAYDIYHGNSNDMGRPERVSERMVYKFAGIPSHRLENMPKCREILSRYKESYAQNWARRLVWAYRKVKADKVDKPVFWCDIRELSGVKKKNAGVVIPLLGQYADKTDTDAIRSLIEPENDINMEEDN